MTGKRLLDGMEWVHSSAPNLSQRLRAYGFVPPEQKAAEAEQESRHEGALRAMKRIQAEMPCSQN